MYQTSTFHFHHFSSHPSANSSSTFVQFSSSLSLPALYPLLGRPAPPLIESIVIWTTIRHVAMRRARPHTTVNSTGSFLSSISQHRLVDTYDIRSARAHAVLETALFFSILYR